MALSDEVNALRQAPLFSCIEIGRLKKLAFASHRVHFDKGEVLFRKGDDADTAYIIIAGRVDVLSDDDGRAIKVAELGVGDIIGEIALLCGGSRTATVRAAENLDVLSIEPKYFLKILSEDSSICVHMMRVLAERLAWTTEQLIAARALASPDPERTGKA
ncbi:cyclic nucleotide-binding domain-containing protein [Paracoccus sp. KR1-242]